MPADACIGSLEHHIHKVFASVRIPGEDFVYSPSADLYSALDDYCDDRTIGESKVPFLILGQSGTGKSALLSNWLQRRKRQAARSRSSEEFIFWHAVGCSRQSLNINSLIRRLIMDLKARFEITRDIPMTQERLSWELPRFLELASKRGKVIIVIDGIHRIATNDSNEANLAWLPLVLPPGVTFVLSATTPTPPPPLKQRSVGGGVTHGILSTTEVHTGRTTGINKNDQNNHLQTKSELSSSSGGVVRMRLNKVAAVLESIEDDNDDISMADNRASKFLADRKKRILWIARQNEIGQKQQSGKSATSSRTGSVAPSRSVTPKLSTIVSNLSTLDTYVHGKGILSELGRRNLKTLKLIPLERTACRAMVDAYIRKSVHSEVFCSSSGEFFLTSLAEDSTGVGTGGKKEINMLQSSCSLDVIDDALAINNNDKYSNNNNNNNNNNNSDDKNYKSNNYNNGRNINEYHNNKTIGFLLFECQIVSLLQHAHGSTPLFLRLFLRCAHNAVNKGFSIWYIWSDWLKATCVSDLLRRILDSFEKGYHPTEEMIQDDHVRTISAGGVRALSALYPWHPYLKNILRESAEAVEKMNQSKGNPQGLISTF